MVLLVSCLACGDVFRRANALVASRVEGLMLSAWLRLVAFPTSCPLGVVVLEALVVFGFAAKVRHGGSGEVCRICRSVIGRSI